jgi:hypothetical protein
MSVGTGRQDIIILFWKQQFNFSEYINEPDIYIRFSPALHLQCKYSGIFVRNIWRIYFVRILCTWKRRMSRGLPAFFRQFWLHFRKNFNWNLDLQRTIY